MTTHPRGCFVLLTDGRTACYGKPITKKKDSGSFHEVIVNDGGVAIVGENQIKAIDDSVAGWKKPASNPDSVQR